jgi:hypothetical protein
VAGCDMNTHPAGPRYRGTGRGSDTSGPSPLGDLMSEIDSRRRGLTRLALSGALDLIARSGGRVGEGYPQDLSGGRRVGNSFLYNSTRALYEEHGFDYVR